MNDADEHFRELLKECPFDGAYHSKHRDEVRESALRAYDEAAAEGSFASVSPVDFSRQRFTRRRTVQMAVIVVAAASLCGALVAWYGRFDNALLSNKSPKGRAVTQSDALKLADQKLVAALNQLSNFDDDRAAATFDQGIQVCLGEHYSQIASMGQRSLGIRGQRD